MTQNIPDIPIQPLSSVQNQLLPNKGTVQKHPTSSPWPGRCCSLWGWGWGWRSMGIRTGWGGGTFSLPPRALPKERPDFIHLWNRGWSATRGWVCGAGQAGEVRGQNRHLPGSPPVYPSFLCVAVHLVLSRGRAHCSFFLLICIPANFTTIFSFLSYLIQAVWDFCFGFDIELCNKDSSGQ